MSTPKVKRPRRPKDKPSGQKPLLVHIPATVLDQFKSTCYLNGRTMRNVVTLMMLAYTRGKFKPAEQITESDLRILS